MNNKMLKMAFAGLVLTVSGFANSAPIVDEFGDINNLNVGGIYYDVSWNFELEPVAADFPLFWNDEAFALLFMGAVQVAFTESGFAIEQQFYGVDYDSLTGVILRDDATGFELLNAVGHLSWADFREAGWGTVTPSEIPEPSTLAIFALGLMGLASRRFKKQS